MQQYVRVRFMCGDSSGVAEPEGLGKRGEYLMWRHGDGLFRLDEPYARECFDEARGDCVRVRVIDEFVNKIPAPRKPEAQTEIPMHKKRNVGANWVRCWGHATNDGTPSPRFGGRNDPDPSSRMPRRQVVQVLPTDSRDPYDNRPRSSGRGMS